MFLRARSISKSVPLRLAIGVTVLWIDLALRNNRTSEDYPDGIFHPHQDVHHIKKENIGLIEVMGLAVLPPRLKDELAEVKKYLLNEPHDIKDIHLPWAENIKADEDVTPENAAAVLQKETARLHRSARVKIHSRFLFVKQRLHFPVSRLHPL